jgi:hypothetical protein
MLGRKKIGELNGDTFFKEVLKSKHLFRVLDAWGIDSKTLNGLPANTKIVIHELEEDLVYKTTKEKYLDGGQYYHFKEQRADHLTQLFLKRNKFEVEKPVQLEGEELAKHNYMVAMGYK